MQIIERDIFGLPAANKYERERSKARLSRLGKEYENSVATLQMRVSEIESTLSIIPLRERAAAEQRLSVLKQEIREARWAGAATCAFYTSSICYVPKAKIKRNTLC